MNWRAIRAIIAKDLRQVRQNRLVWLPMVIVPAILQVVVPLATVMLPALAGPSEFEGEDMTALYRALPADLAALMASLSGVQQWVYMSANYLFAPLFLVVPLMIASILAADSFAGEKERRTLESLLYTPTTDEELFVAKVLGAMVPSQVIGLASFVVYGLTVNLAGQRIMGRVFFPATMWWPLVLWLGPAMALLGLGATVLISSKVSTFMQAQQIGGLLVLPLVGLMIAQMSGVLFMSPTLILILGLAAWAIGAWLVWIGARTFARGEIIARI